MLVALEINQNIVRSVPLFESLRKFHIALICQRLRQIWVPPTEIVIAYGDIGREMYLVRRGTLDVISQDGKTKFATLRSQAYFGEVYLQCKLHTC